MTTRYNQLMDQFSTTDLHIDYEKLEKYITFCIDHDRGATKKNHSKHHVLPASATLPFGTYKDLNAHPWNAAVLSYADHYRAHFLLAQAINHIATLTAFAGMHRKDFELGRLTEDDLIPAEAFDELYAQRNLKLSSWQTQIIETPDGPMSRIAYHTQYLRKRNDPEGYEAGIKKTRDRMTTNNIIHSPGALKKMRATKSALVNGVSLDTISSQRAASTMKQAIVIDGVETTQYEQNGKKLSEYLTKTIVVDGVETTMANIRGANVSKILRARGKRYRIKNVFNPDYEKIMDACDARGLSAALPQKTKEDYLGKTLFAKNTLIRNGKGDLIGLYAELLPSNH